MSAQRVQVAVVGGGIGGLSVAYALAGHTDVALLEAAAIGTAGASSLPAALLNPRRGRTARAHPEDLAGLRAFWRRDRALGGLGLATGAAASGILRIASTARQADLWRGSAGEGVRFLDSAVVPGAYHAPHGALLVAEGGWVRPGVHLRALAEAVRTSGGEVCESTRVLQLVRAPGTWLLETDRGSWSARQVVLASGAERPPGVVAYAGQPEADDPLRTVPDPLVRVAGDVLELDLAAGFPIPLAGAVYGASAGGSAWIGGHHREPSTSDPDAGQNLRRSFSWFVPSVRDAPIVRTWTGVRLKRPGNRPLIRELDDGLWWFGALAGRGFLCGAAEAERLADAILHRLATSAPAGTPGQGRASE